MLALLPFNIHRPAACLSCTLIISLQDHSIELCCTLCSKHSLSLSLSPSLPPPFSPPPPCYRTIRPNSAVRSIFKASGCSDNPNHYVNYLEHVVVRVTITHPRRGDLAIYLTSPSGTRSQLLANRYGYGFCPPVWWSQPHLAPSRWKRTAAAPSSRGGHRGARECHGLIAAGQRMGSL